MPITTRAKRALAESDPNAELAPAAKKIPKGRANGKENSAPVTNTLLATVEDQAQRTGKDRDPPIVTEKNSAPIAEDVVGAAQLAGFNQSASNAIRDQKGKVSRGANGKKWICLCVPSDMDPDKERDSNEDSDEISDEDFDEDEDEDEDEEVTGDADIGVIRPRCDGGVRCMCKKPAEDYPDHKWIVTQKGFALSLEWLQQVENRHQENFDMYISNDFNGYGICEVMENILLAFAKEEKKKRIDPMAMWSVVESLALFLRGDHLFHWKMLDNSEGNAKHIMLIGTALLTAVVLIQEKIYSNDKAPKIRNQSLILSLFLQFADRFHEICSHNEDGWTLQVVGIADTFKIPIEGVAGIAKIIERIRKSKEASGSDSKSISQKLSREEAEIEAKEKMWACYENAPGMEWGVITLESLTRARGEVRDWKKGWCWIVELDAYCAHQAVKDWGYGPSYEEEEMGGRIYDLTARKNKGWHMERYQL